MSDENERIPRELNFRLKWYIRMHSALIKTLWCFGIGLALGLLWVAVGGR